MGLHAEEDEVGRGTGQAALEVRAAPNLLGLRVEAVEGLHGLLKELPLNPTVQLWGELGLELADGPIAVVSLDKDLGGQRGTSPELLQIVDLSGHVPGALTAPSPLRAPSRRDVGAADSGSRWVDGDKTRARALSAVLMLTSRTRAPMGGWAGGRLGPGDDHCAVRGADKSSGPERRGRTRGSSGPDR